MRIQYCEACHASVSGIKSRIAYVHTCGRTITEAAKLKRGNRTTIDKLEYGDRFYKLSDNNQLVFTKVHYGTSDKCYAKKDDDKWPTEIRKNVVIVFLRHAE